MQRWCAPIYLASIVYACLPSNLLMLTRDICPQSLRMPLLLFDLEIGTLRPCFNLVSMYVVSAQDNEKFCDRRNDSVFQC